MDLHHLRIFVTVYNKRSFSLASKELKISQPTISEHIKNLEAELGTPLFDRLPRTVLPTKAAESIYTRSVHILEEADSIADLVRSSSEEVTGLLKVGSSTIPGTFIIPRLAGAFKKKHPEVSFEIVIGDSLEITERLVSHDLVLGVTGAVIDKSRLNYTPFASDELVLAALPSMLPEGKVTPAGLPRLPLVMRESGSGTRRASEEQILKAGVNPNDLNIVGTLGSSSAVKEAVLSGLGASIFSRLSIEKDLLDGTLREIPIKGIDMKRNFYVVTHKRRQLSSPYSHFMEALQSFMP